MALPTQTEVELPLLETLIEIGGIGKPKDIYPLVTKKFPSITEEDLQINLISGGNKWTNSIQWARQKLIYKGELISPERGIWQITDIGRKRVENKAKEKDKAPTLEIQNLEEIYNQYDETFRNYLLERLLEFSSKQFEIFAKKLLIAYGFINVHVTNQTADGGIDGYGKLKVGLSSMNVAFQCKRWQGNVGRPEIDKFRGSIQGEYEQGIFFTTSDFTKRATEVSFKKGTVPIVLMNGEAIVDLMIQKNFGVKKNIVYIFQAEEGLFDEPRE